MTVNEPRGALTCTGKAWGKSHEAQTAVTLPPCGAEYSTHCFQKAEESIFKIVRSVCKDHRAQQKGPGHQTARALRHRNYHTCAPTQPTEKELASVHSLLIKKRKIQAFVLHKDMSCINSLWVFSICGCLLGKPKCRRWELQPH